MELKGSKTEANLLEAFAGESMARNKYTYYASRARKDGFQQIAAFFEETAGNEKEHAKLWLKELGGIGTTAENLLAAAEGEHEEWTDMYQRMANEAREEGFHRIADMFLGVAEIEKSHYGILSFWRTWRTTRSSRRAASRCGTAATAAIWSTATRPPRYVPCAAIPSPISS